jgi:SAM-dependent methyltransferase
MRELIDRKLNYGRHHVRDFLSRAPFSSALDLGAGHGDDLAIAHDVRPDARLFAIENWAPYVEQLRARGVTVYDRDIERDTLPFENGELDVVLMNQVMEHLKDIFWVLHEATRTLRVGGRLILGVPNLASLHNRLLLALGRQPTAIQSHSAHVRGFTRPDVERLMEHAWPGGYRLIGFGGSNFYPFPPIVARPLARVWPQAAWGIFFCFEKTKPYESAFLDYPRDAKLETRFYLGS